MKKWAILYGSGKFYLFDQVISEGSLLVPLGTIRAVTDSVVTLDPWGIKVELAPISEMEPDCKSLKDSWALIKTTTNVSGTNKRYTIDDVKQTLDLSQD